MCKLLRKGLKRLKLRYYWIKRAVLAKSLHRGKGKNKNMILKIVWGILITVYNQGMVSYFKTAKINRRLVPLLRKYWQNKTKLRGWNIYRRLSTKNFQLTIIVTQQFLILKMIILPNFKKPMTTIIIYTEQISQFLNTVEAEIMILKILERYIEV